MFRLLNHQSKKKKTNIGYFETNLGDISLKPVLKETITRNEILQVQKGR